MAQLLERPAGRGQHPAGRVVAAAQRLEHGLAAQRGRLDGRGAARDAQHPHDVEAPPAGPGDRVRAPQRRDGRAGEDRGGPTPVAGATGRGQGAVERRLALGDPAEPGQRRGPHGVRLGLARGIAELGERAPRPPRRVPAVAASAPASRRLASSPAKQAAQASSRGEPGRHVRELGDRAGRLGGVAHREQRLAALDQQRRPDRRSPAGRHPRARPEERRGHRPVVGLERAPARRGEAVGGGPAERRRVLAGLDPQPVGLLELVADHVVVLHEVAHLDLEPAGGPLVQLGAGLLEEPSVGGVADEDVVEAEHRLVEPVGAGRLDELLAAQPLEVRRRGGRATSGGTQRAEHPAVEGLPDDRRRLEHGALAGRQPVDAGGQQRVDRERAPRSPRRRRRPVHAPVRRARARRRPRACARARRRTAGCPRWPPRRGRAARPGDRSRRRARG